MFLTYSRFWAGAMLVVGTATTLLAADAAGKAELEKLEQQRAELTVKMVDKRLELIRNDKDLQIMYAKIIAMHKELTLLLNTKPEMRELLQQADALDAEIAKLKQP